MGRMDIDFDVEPHVPSILQIAISGHPSVRRDRHPGILTKIELLPVSLELVEAESLGFPELLDLGGDYQRVNGAQFGNNRVSNAISRCE
jgi:hypothetical protein